MFFIFDSNTCQDIIPCSQELGKGGGERVTSNAPGFILGTLTVCVFWRSTSSGDATLYIIPCCQELGKGGDERVTSNVPGFNQGTVTVGVFWRSHFILGRHFHKVVTATDFVYAYNSTK